MISYFQVYTPLLDFLNTRIGKLNLI
jgi:hypothetical protein